MKMRKLFVLPLFLMLSCLSAVVLSELCALAARHNEKTDTAAAAGWYEKALFFNPFNAQAHVSFAACILNVPKDLARSKDISKDRMNLAIELLDKALALNDKDTMSHYNRAKLEYSRHRKFGGPLDTGVMVRHLKAAFETDPAHLFVPSMIRELLMAAYPQLSDQDEKDFAHYIYKYSFLMFKDSRNDFIRSSVLKKSSVLESSAAGSIEKGFYALRSGGAIEPLETLEMTNRDLSFFICRVPAGNYMLTFKAQPRPSKGLNPYISVYINDYLREVIYADSAQAEYNIPVTLERPQRLFFIFELTNVYYNPLTRQNRSVRLLDIRVEPCAHQ